MSWDIFQVLTDLAVGDRGEEIFGRKPEVAGYKPTDLGDEAGRAVSANIRNLPEIQALLEKILPGYGSMVAQGSKNTMSLLRGELPKDVQAAIQRSSAYKSLQGGYSGSPMSKAVTARDLGRTSLDLTQMGENSAARWAGLTQAGVAPFTVTAAGQGAQTEKNNLYDQAVRQFAFNIAAAPNPVEAGKFNLQTAMGSMAASFGMSSALQGMGGGQRQQPTQLQPAQQPAYGGNTGGGNPSFSWGSYGWGG